MQQCIEKFRDFFNGKQQLVTHNKILLDPKQDADADHGKEHAEHKARHPLGLMLDKDVVHKKLEK